MAELIWGAYVPFVRPHAGRMGDLPPSAARECHDLLMAQRSERVAALAELLETNGVRFGWDEEHIRAVNEWFIANVRTDQAMGCLTERWAGVALDIGVYLCEVLIKRFPHLRWDFLSNVGKDHPAFQHSVVNGFRSDYYQEYDVDLIDFVNTLGVQVTMREPDEEDAGSFVRGTSYEFEAWI